MDKLEQNKEQTSKIQDKNTKIDENNNKNNQNLSEKKIVQVTPKKVEEEEDIKFEYNFIFIQTKKPGEIKAQNEQNEENLKDNKDKEKDEENDKQDSDNQLPEPENNEKKPFKIMTLKELVSLERKIRQNKRLTIDLTNTRYEIVREIANLYTWNIITNNNEDKQQDYSIRWYDTYIQEEQLRYVLPYQKITRFPGSFNIGRKNLLARNLMRMKKAHPEEFSFSPRTWLLPNQYEELRKFQFRNNFSKYLIVKPENLCQGKGIFLTRKIDNVLEYGEHYVIQEYLPNPYLLDSLKFDFRIYVMVKSVVPLKVFIFKEGLVRFATNPYEKPSKSNFQDMMMHLTNYAINKQSENFQFNQKANDDDSGHKRSLSSVLQRLMDEGKDVEQLWKEIKKIVVKTFTSVLPNLQHIYRSCQPKEENSEMCFELFGFDVMVDENLKPYLLEVNHTPSFTADTPLDYYIKKSLLLDTIIMINSTRKARKQYYESRENLNPSIKGNMHNKLTKEEIEINRQKVYNWENNHMGGFERIFPEENDKDVQQEYLNFIQTAQDQFDSWSGAKINRVVKKEQPKELPQVKPLQQQKILQQKKNNNLQKQQNNVNGVKNQKENSNYNNISNLDQYKKTPQISSSSNQEDNQQSSNSRGSIFKQNNIQPSPYQAENRQVQSRELQRKIQLEILQKNKNIIQQQQQQQQQIQQQFSQVQSQASLENYDLQQQQQFQQHVRIKNKNNENNNNNQDQIDQLLKNQQQQKPASQGVQSQQQSLLNYKNQNPILQRSFYGQPSSLTHLNTNERQTISQCQGYANSQSQSQINQDNNTVQKFSYNQQKSNKMQQLTVQQQLQQQQNSDKQQQQFTNDKQYFATLAKKYLSSTPKNNMQNVEGNLNNNNNETMNNEKTSSFNTIVAKKNSLPVNGKVKYTSLQKKTPQYKLDFNYISSQTDTSQQSDTQSQKQQCYSYKQQSQQQYLIQQQQQQLYQLKQKQNPNFAENEKQQNGQKVIKQAQTRYLQQEEKEQLQKATLQEEFNNLANLNSQNIQAQQNGNFNRQQNKRLNTDIQKYYNRQQQQNNINDGQINNSVNKNKYQQLNNDKLKNNSNNNSNNKYINQQQIFLQQQQQQNNVKSIPIKSFNFSRNLIKFSNE